MGPARGSSDLAGRECGEMGGKTKEGRLKEGGRFAEDGEKGVSSGHQEKPSSNYKMDGTNGDSKATRDGGGVAHKGAGEKGRGEGVEGQHFGDGDGWSTRGPGQHGLVQKLSSSHLKDELRVEEWGEGGGGLGEAGGASPSQDRPLIPYRKGDGGGGEGGYPGRCGDHVDHSGEGPGYPEPQGEGGGGGCGGDEGSLCHRENSHEPTLYGKLSGSFLEDKGIPPPTKGEGRGSRSNELAFPRGESGGSKNGVAEGGCAPGGTLGAKGGPAASGSGGYVRRKSDALLPTQECTNPPPVPGLWVDVRGRGGEGQEGERSGGKGGGRGPPLAFGKGFLDPPSWEEIQRDFPQLGGIQRKVFPLNVKRVGPGKMDMVKKLPCLHQECKYFLNSCLRILDDESMYKEAAEKTNPKPMKKPSLSRGELGSLIDYKLERAKVKPLWGTFPFKVAEPHKKRCRAIFDCSINFIFLESPKYQLKNKVQIRRIMEKKGAGIIFLQFDFKAYYDQFTLSQVVRKYFGVLGHDDVFYNLILLPMGFRLAVALAQAMTWALLDFLKSDEVDIITCIDNIGMKGPRELVYNTAEQFLKRVEECGFTLNGMEDLDFTNLPKEGKEAFLKSLEEDKFDFLGEHYNLVTNERCLTSKTVEKTKLVWGEMSNILKDCTVVKPRQLFALIGLLVYSSDVLDIKTYSIFNFFKKVRGWARFLQEDVRRWDEEMRCTLSPGEYREVQVWVETSIANRPVPMGCGRKEDPKEPDRYLVVDASGEGWGAVLYDKEKRYITFVAEKWRKNDYGSSVKAEPAGLERAVGRLKHLLRGLKVAIYTDHENLVFASKAIFIHNYFYNKCLTVLERVSKEEKTKFYLNFIKGEDNTADGISRGKGGEYLKGTTLCVVGPGLCSALQQPWQH